MKFKEIIQYIDQIENNNNFSLKRDIRLIVNSFSLNTNLEKQTFFETKNLQTK